ncbi:MAG: cytochrome c oxidase assembly factor Coa1 family protein [Thermoguttaceae bacterium]|jgi:hypothetical protein
MESPEGVLTARPLHRGWWSRNWRWFLPTALLLLIVLCVGAGIVYLNSKATYQMALEQVRKDPNVVERLGRPIQPARWIPSGDEHLVDDRGDAHWDFKITGPKGSADVRTQSRRLSGQWTMTMLEVVFSDGKRLMLETNGGDEAPKFGAGGDVAPKFSPSPGGATPKRDVPVSPGKEIPGKEIPSPSQPGKAIPGKEIHVEPPRPDADAPPGGEIKLEIPK